MPAPAESARLTFATELERELYEALKAHEAWEADIILHADWSRSTPRLTEEQMDALTAVQERRNAALARAALTPPDADETTCVTCGIEFTGEPDQTECDRCWGETQTEMRNDAGDARHEAARERRGE